MIFLILVVFVGNVFAQEIWVEDYPVAAGDIESVQPSADEDYRWLYEILMPVNFQNELPSEAFKSFRVHLKDSYKQFPTPEQIQQKNLKSIRSVSGTMTYERIIKKKYRYDIVSDPQGFVIHVRVHLKNPTASDKVNFSQKMKEAQDLWNESRIETDFQYQFHFEIVSESAKAHFSVSVLDTTRGPYDTNWGRDWTGRVVAHEGGHIFGLGD